MAPPKKKRQESVKESAQKPTLKSNLKPEAAGTPQSQSQSSLRTTKRSTPHQEEVAMESTKSSSSSLQAGRCGGKKRPREEGDDDDEEQDKEAPVPVGPSSSASVPVFVSTVGMNTRSSSRSKIALDGPVTHGKGRPLARDTISHSSASDTLPDPDRIRSDSEDNNSIERSSSEEDEPSSSHTHTHNAGTLSQQVGTSSALETELSAVHCMIEEMESELAAAKKRLKEVSPHFELMERALRRYPSSEDWNNAKAQLPHEFPELSKMTFDELKSDKASYHTEKNNLEASVNRLKEDIKSFANKKEQLEKELKPVKASGMMASSTTSSVFPSIKAFLSIVTAKQDLPVLSLEAFAKRKKTNKVSELTRVDVPPRKRAGAEPVLQGFVLPEDLSWPFFGVAKQRLAEDKHVLVHRVQGMNAVRSDKVLDVIKGGGSVAIIGSPGIGKSSSMNYFLMEFVRHLGEPDWKKVMLVRYGTTFLKIFRDEVSGEIQCEEYSVSSLSDMNKMLEQYWKASLDEISQMVLLLELEEDEVDPKPGGIPCVVTASNRDAREVLKTMEKTGKLKWFLEEPHSEQEAEAVVCLLNGASPSGNKYDWLNVVKPRWEIIPRPREYLSSESPKKQVVSNEFFQALKGCTIFDVPQGASGMVAPYYASEATEPDVSEPLSDGRPCYELKLFNLEGALRVGKAMKDNEHLRAVEILGVRWQIEEAYAAYGGLLKNKEDVLDVQFTHKRWEWFQDLGPGQDCLIEGNKLPRDTPPVALPHCDSLQSFPSQFFKETAHQMVEDQLYHSTKHNSPLVDYLYLHDNTIYAVQVSSLPCERHQFNMETLRSFLNRLGLLAPKRTREKYKFAFLYIMGKNVENSRGMGVVVEEKIPKASAEPLKKKKKKNTEVSYETVTHIMSLQDALKTLNPGLSCTSYLIRARLLKSFEEG